MNSTYRNNFKAANLLLLILSPALLAIGCSTTTTENKPRQLSQPVIEQLSEPSLIYMFDTNETDSTSPRNIETWVAIAKKNYEAKHYARALRAAEEALNINNQMVEARQIAMLSAVKMMESSVDAYHNDDVMEDRDKSTFKKTLTNITTLVNASN
ncbi:hypothetical protein [Psychrobacter sp. JB385]|uniref:hypothetical protein n=1 Tax=Psychrobacter sp. JB385 TaxID=1434841 RepID=UPI00097EE6ED|nr:hypothetical protein [Psychrobacter sp. JB385]SJN35369.1 hypothetical protein CZ794_08885 [Psychrobacter sp. JB385]